LHLEAEDITTLVARPPKACDTPLKNIKEWNIRCSIILSELLLQFQNLGVVDLFVIVTVSGHKRQAKDPTTKLNCNSSFGTALVVVLVVKSLIEIA
jgi:hypothetical protein